MGRLVGWLVAVNQHVRCVYGGPVGVGGGVGGNGGIVEHNLDSSIPSLMLLVLLYA